MPARTVMDTKARSKSPRSGYGRAASAAFALCFTLGCASGGQGEAAPQVPGPNGVTSADQEATEQLNRRITLAAARATDMGESADDTYRIGPEDQLDIRVFSADAFSGVYRVSSEGEISMPLVGEIHVAGQTPTTLEQTLEERLSEKYMREPNVTVQIAEVQSRAVSVIGAVTTPGVYQVRGRVTLLEVLAMAQGLTEAAGAEVLIVRSGRNAAGPDSSFVSAASTTVADTSAGAEGASTGGVPSGEVPGMPPGADIVEVNLTRLLESGGADIVVRPGDVVQVPPAKLVYVAGEVNRPGGFALTAGEPITVLQAVALAEGLGRTAASGRSIIVRQREDGSKEEIPVDLEAVLDGEEAAPLLQPSDVLFIPNNDTKSVALGVVDAFVRMFTLRGLIY